jgi:hypothetical protein
MGCGLLSLWAGMRRREFIAAIGGTAVWPLAVRAQQSGRIPVVGVFWAYADPRQRLRADGEVL